MAANEQSGPWGFDYHGAHLDICENVADPPRRQIKSADVARPIHWRTRLFDPVDPFGFQQGHVWRRGRVCWGALVQANALLFSKGDQPCPANMIVSHDVAINANPMHMLEVASTLYSLKHTTGIDPEFQDFIDVVTGELERVFNVEIPLSRTGSVPMYFTTVLIDPRHLPESRITGSVFPILHDLSIRNTLVIPHTYWPTSFKKQVWGQ